MSSSEGLSRLWVLAIYQTAELHRFHLIRLTTGFGMKGVKWWRSLQDGVVGINDPLEAICPQTHTHTYKPHTHIYTQTWWPPTAPHSDKNSHINLCGLGVHVCVSLILMLLRSVWQLAESVSYRINCTGGVCMTACVFAYTITYLMQTKYT